MNHPAQMRRELSRHGRDTSSVSRHRILFCNKIAQIKLLTVLSGLLFSHPMYLTAAEIYKWTDKNGRIHYGDHPGNQDSEQIFITNSGSASAAELQRIKKRNRLLEVLEEEREGRKRDMEEASIAKENKKTNCELAKNNLQLVRNSSYLFEESDDPFNPRILTDEERNTASKNAEKAVSEWCS